METTQATLSPGPLSLPRVPSILLPVSFPSPPLSLSLFLSSIPVFRSFFLLSFFPLSFSSFSFSFFFFLRYCQLHARLNSLSDRGGYPGYKFLSLSPRGPALSLCFLFYDTPHPRVQFVAYDFHPHPRSVREKRRFSRRESVSPRDSWFPAPSVRPAD